MQLSKKRAPVSRTSRDWRGGQHFRANLAVVLRPHEEQSDARPRGAVVRFRFLEDADYPLGGSCRSSEREPAAFVQAAPARRRRPTVSSPDEPRRAEPRVGDGEPRPQKTEVVGA